MKSRGKPPFDVVKLGNLGRANYWHLWELLQRVRYMHCLGGKGGEVPPTILTQTLIKYGVAHSASLAEY